MAGAEYRRHLINFTNNRCTAALQIPWGSIRRATTLCRRLYIVAQHTGLGAACPVAKGGGIMKDVEFPAPGSISFGTFASGQCNNKVAVRAMAGETPLLAGPGTGKALDNTTNHYEYIRVYPIYHDCPLCLCLDEAPHTTAAGIILDSPHKIISLSSCLVQYFVPGLNARGMYPHSHVPLHPPAERLTHPARRESLVVAAASCPEMIPEWRTGGSEAADKEMSTTDERHTLPKHIARNTTGLDYREKNLIEASRLDETLVFKDCKAEPAVVL
ncbi:hypothetical protein E2C01_040726 [Portunus trituberculatus]|uniref:Uncharacterized protein n=1 Tax=Portunus trituberculatus TaxID=210409 RepID=A0A5B7FKJ7_PORTR|nr:hypothetical protein [Portunus trituberculatus]